MCRPTNKNEQVEHTVVQHDYHDHANDVPSDEAKSFNKFPMRLFALLDQAQHDQIAHIISWQPHGRCFAIHKPKELQAILPKYFKVRKDSDMKASLENRILTSFSGHKNEIVPPSAQYVWFPTNYSRT